MKNLVRRKSALNRLRGAVGRDFDKVRLLLSCEALLLPGLSEAEDLPMLAVPGTNLLPIAVAPCTALSVKEKREIANLVQRCALCPLYCHVERIFPLFGDSFFDFLLQKHAAFLVSPRAFSDPTLMQILLRAIRHGARIFLGSNAHSADGEPYRQVPPAGSGLASTVHRMIFESTDELFDKIRK